MLALVISKQIIAFFFKSLCDRESCCLPSSDLCHKCHLLALHELAHVVCLEEKFVMAIKKNYKVFKDLYDQCN